MNKSQLIAKLIKYKIDFKEEDFKNMTSVIYEKYLDLYIKEKERLKLNKSLDTDSDFKKRIKKEKKALADFDIEAMNKKADDNVKSHLEKRNSKQ